MKSHYLFPHKFKKIGWLILFPCLVIGVLYLIFNEQFVKLEMNVFAIFDLQIFQKNVFFGFTKTDIVDEILGVLIIIGALLVAFSREKLEDEFITRIRLESLVWSTYLNYGILISSMLLLYSVAFFWVLVMNIFTILFFFIIRFNWVLMKSKKLAIHEE